MNAKSATTRSTAGPGFAFEDLVAADLLSRFLIDMTIDAIGVPGTHILSQAAALGWPIDDLICIGIGDDGIERRLAISCKSNVQVTKNGWPADFIAATWTLWNEQDPFRRATDRLALVTRGHNAAFDAIWSDLKTWCVRADVSFALARINGSQKHRRVFDSVRSPGLREGELPSEADTVALITALEIYPLDFQLSPSTALADAKARCRTALCSESLAEAEDLWQALVDSAETARLGNGTNRLPDLIRALSPRFALKAHPSIAASWNRLQALSADHRGLIEVSLSNGHVVDRPKENQQLTEALSKGRGCVVVGDSGVGKSALVRNVLDEHFANAVQIWLGPQEVTAALSQTGRRAMGLDHDLELVLQRSPGKDKLLILDSVERLDAATTVRLNALLLQLAEDRSWRVLLVSQHADFEDQLRALTASATWTKLIVPALANTAIRWALASEPSLHWISHDHDVLPLLANLRTLGWVIAAASSFHQDDNAALTSTAAIADRLWTRWTTGPAATQLQRLLMRLAVRDAAFERSFAISDLEAADLAAFDQRTLELPLTVNARNRIEFRHDLASDWARYQRLKEIADDIPQWAALATQPLWIAALRLFGQHLLGQTEQERHGWDHAFATVTALDNVAASDVLLDALCLDPQLDRHLTDRADLMFANDGALLKRLFHRFLFVATVPSIPSQFAVDDGLRIYLEADMRFPIMARWAPMGRFLRENAERVGALGAPIVPRLCKAWLSSLPATLGDEPMPLRDVMAKVALETARAEQVMSIARRHFGGSDQDKLIYATALSGAADLKTEISDFALEMAQRRPVAGATQARIDALRAADRARSEERARDAPPRRRPPPPPTFLPSHEELPPWPLGPSDRVVGAFRDAVLHDNALAALMRADPDVATEVLLASLIDDHPTREFGRSVRLDDELGLEFDQQSYPTIFWKGPFFTYLNQNPDAALAALKTLLDFVMERWAAGAPEGAHIPSLSVTLADGAILTFPGHSNHFGWSQHNSTSNGQLSCALDALERWLTLKVDAGEDMAPWCERLLGMETSTAIVGVLVNLGKFCPSLFTGPLAPLAEIETLYWWDSERVNQIGFNFDSFHWSRQGDVIFNMARDWVLAPHRRRQLREVIGELAAGDARFAERVMAAAATWPEPDDLKERLELRILRSELDPANRQDVLDPATGEKTVQLAYPAELQADVIAFQTRANASLEPLTLPRQCEKVLAGNATLADESAEYLAGLLPEPFAPETAGSDRLPMIAAAAATLIARGGDWFAAKPEVARRAQGVVRAIIKWIDANRSKREELESNEALRFAAIGALHAAMEADQPELWNEALAQILTSRDRGAIATLMHTAERHRVRLGPAWYRLNFLLLLTAGLDRLSPRYEEDALLPLWHHWRARLRQQPIFGTAGTIDIVEPAVVARHVERLLERRRARARPDRPFRLTGKSRRFAGLSAHILESGFAWLLDHERAAYNAQEAENHQLLADLWTFEAWRMEGEGDEREDEEYDLPSGMGYAVLRIAAQFVMAAPVDDPTPLWRSILAIGPKGYHAVEQFASGWFLQLFNKPDADRFLTIWKTMLDAAFAADWRSGRRWYRGREMLEKLLGLNSHVELSQATDVAVRLPELIDYYRRWMVDITHDEDEIATFCYFLTTEAGRTLRLPGVIWLKDAVAQTDKFYRGSTGNNVAEAINTILNHHSADLVKQPAARDAVIAIVAKLVRGQVATAMGLQKRIATLR